MMFAHHVICAAFHIVNASTENSCIRARPKYIFAKNEHQLLPDLTEYNLLLLSTSSFIVMMHVPHQIVYFRA